VSFSEEFKFFGVPLDATDDPDKVELKRSYALGMLPWKPPFPNPYRGVVNFLKNAFNLEILEAGEMPVDSWLTPTPSIRDLPLVNPENYSIFIHGDGCHEYANLVTRFVDSRVFPGKPVMVAVDHSMTGGVLKTLAEKLGPENLAVLVFDSHFDGIEARDRMELLKYAKEHPVPLLTFEADFSEEPPETYNCATFLKYLLDDKTILAENLAVIGVSDYPPEEAREDERLKGYCEAYLKYERENVHFITKHEVRQRKARELMVSLFDRLNAPYVYISLDADVGSFKSVYAARTMNAIGLSEEQLRDLSLAVAREVACRKKKLIGFDVCEINTYFTGYEFEAGMKDRTYEVLGSFMKNILFP